jgi:hypothetical protein
LVRGYFRKDLGGVARKVLFKHAAQARHQEKVICQK